MLCGRPVGLAWEKEGISWGQILVEYTEVWPEKAPGPSRMGNNYKPRGGKGCAFIPPWECTGQCIPETSSPGIYVANSSASPTLRVQAGSLMPENCWEKS